MHPERIFIFVGLLFGLLFLIVTPPFQAPDEPAHFFRAYEISDLGIIAERQGDSVGDFLPQSLTVIVDELMADIPHNLKKKRI